MKNRILNYIHFVKNQFFLIKIKTKFYNRLKIAIFALLKIFLKPIQIFDKNLYFKIRYALVSSLYKDVIIELNNKKFKIRDDIDLMTILADEKIDNFFKEDGRIFLDIGAHIGKYSILYSDYFEKIYAFEPEPNNFECLKENIKTNNLENKIISLNLAVADENGFIGFFLSPYSVTHSLVKKETDKKITVECISLDEFFKKFGISASDISLIKIDVEGAENLVIKGLEENFDKLQCKFIIEIWENNLENKKFITDFLKKFDYKLEKIYGDYYLAYYENSSGK
jgi:FkbM family methyltransferase